jgi:hypothetical protein
VTRTGETIEADGTTTSFAYTAKYDGADYPVKGSRDLDSISLTRISDRIVEAILKKAGQTVRAGRRVVSPDGRNLHHNERWRSAGHCAAIPTQRHIRPAKV